MLVRLGARQSQSYPLTRRRWRALTYCLLRLLSGVEGVSRTTPCPPDVGGQDADAERCLPRAHAAYPNPSNGSMFHAASSQACAGHVGRRRRPKNLQGEPRRPSGAGVHSCVAPLAAEWRRKLLCAGRCGNTVILNAYQSTCSSPVHYVVSPICDLQTAISCSMPRRQAYPRSRRLLNAPSAGEGRFQWTVLPRDPPYHKSVQYRDAQHYAAHCVRAGYPSHVLNSSLLLSYARCIPDILRSKTWPT